MKSARHDHKQHCQPKHTVDHTCSSRAGTAKVTMEHPAMDPALHVDIGKTDKDVTHCPTVTSTPYVHTDFIRLLSSSHIDLHRSSALKTA